MFLTMKNSETTKTRKETNMTAVATPNMTTPNVETNANRNDFHWIPRANVLEAKEHFLIEVEVPGVAKDSLGITFENRVLTLSGERPLPAGENIAWRRRERAHGRFQRRFTVAVPVKADDITASYTDGVLTVTLPKAEEVRERTIAIQ